MALFIVENQFYNYQLVLNLKYIKIKNIYKYLNGCSKKGFMF